MIYISISFKSVTKMGGIRNYRLFGGRLKLINMKVRNFKIPGTAFLCLVVGIFSMMQLKAQISYPTQSEYRYLKGNEAASLPSDWMGVDYDDLEWTAGNAPFWYGDSTSPGTRLDMSGNYSTLYLRSSFSAYNIENIQEITIYVAYDDGFVLWINGEEVLSRNAPAVYSYNAIASGQHEYNEPETIVLSRSDLNLQEGGNVIAVQGFNISLSGSSDFYFDMSVDAETIEPVLNDTIGIGFSYPSGFYSNSFNLTLTSPDPSATIIYTLDGSNPQTSATGYNVGSSTTFTIDPLSTTGRGTTPAVIVRASLIKNGYLPSYPDARTYIFLNQVKVQTYPGYDWPDYNVNNQIIDYDMDPDVVNDPRYSGSMNDVLLNLPSISIITDNKNLFDPATGIYVNALGHGFDWERECSVELINPDGSAGFNVDAGLRIRGGYSRHEWYPKHGFRLFFRSDYGDSKLHYALFGNEGVDQFDKIDLRCEQNYSWANADYRNTMLREVFSRDTQRDMGRPYSRSKYYHLYLNGMYWGIFQAQERSEARYASDYFGDKTEDYDVVKVNSDGYQVEATDGTIATWQTIYSKVNHGFDDNASYFALEGKNENGKPVPGDRIWVDIDNLIDYMMVIFYTGNFDAPTSSFMSNKGPNNFYGILNKKDKTKGFIFFNHDGEHAMFYDPAWPGSGISENRVNIGSRTDDYKMTVGSLYSFHPQWLHYKLSANEEYRLRFADRAALCFTNNGALTPGEASDRLNVRVAEITNAVTAESARWGDAQRSDAPYTKDDTWAPQVNQIISSFFPVRTNIVINQLRQAGLYPDIDNPEITKNDNPFLDQEMSITASTHIGIHNPNSSGVLYYTLNDTDPRLIGGDVSGFAIEGNDDVTLTINSSAIIKTRVYDAGDWSAIREVKIYSNADDLSNLKITEINYHPLDLIVGNDTTEGSDFEFMEFKNIGESSLNLSEITVDSAIYYKFPVNTLLAPGQFYVIASKPTTFYEKYGMVASGNFSGNLSNSGEEILINDAQGSPIIHFAYDDHSPWPEEPDGDGPSLVSADFNPTGDPGNAVYWRASLRIGGSPFEDDTPPNDIEEPMANASDIGTITVFPNPTTGLLHIKIDNYSLIDPVLLHLYSMEGAMVMQTKVFNNTVLDLGGLGLEAGIYILRIETDSQFETKKIIYNP
jgi:hypothetical protein